ncbi:MAG: hypothetical protein WDO73_16055 [Ignavibacteriota bacterium]
MGGSVSRRIAPLKEQLLELIALLEAGIDFAEDDISVAPPSEIRRRLVPIRTGIRQLAESFQYGALVREGVTLAAGGVVRTWEKAACSIDSWSRIAPS